MSISPSQQFRSRFFMLLPGLPRSAEAEFRRKLWPLKLSDQYLYNWSLDIFSMIRYRVSHPHEMCLVMLVVVVDIDFDSLHIDQLFVHKSSITSHVTQWQESPHVECDKFIQIQMFNSIAWNQTSWHQTYTTGWLFVHVTPLFCPSKNAGWELLSRKSEATSTSGVGDFTKSLRVFCFQGRKYGFFVGF